MTLYDYFLDHIDLQNQWNYAKNSKSPEMLKTSSREKVWWKCDQGHEWRATPGARIYAGRGCPYCANQKINSGENDMATISPQMARLWHPNRNGNLTPSDISAGSRKYVWWQCEHGHEWRAPAYSIKAGTGCPYCAGKKPILGETDLATTHPHIAQIWSPKNKLSPTALTAGSKKRVWLICERGHEWESTVYNVALNDSGCPYCAGKKAIPGETDLATLRPELLEQWDFEKNTRSPREVMVGTGDKIWWKCELGHSWKAVVFSRTRENASGCPYCTGRKVLPSFNDLVTLKPKLAGEWYQPLNGTLKPEDVTLGSNKQVWWQCADGHVWKAYIYARTKPNGTGCPVCSGKVKCGPTPKKNKEKF